MKLNPRLVLAVFSAIVLAADKTDGAGGIAIATGIGVSAGISLINSLSKGNVAKGQSYGEHTLEGHMRYHEQKYSVVVGFEIENWTKWTLTDPTIHLEGGYVAVPPTPISPGTKEIMITRKGNGWAGSYGTVSWYIPQLKRRVYAMWSAPYSHMIFSNVLAVGMSMKGFTETQGHDDFNMMYWKPVPTEDTQRINFRRNVFRNQVDPVEYSDNRIQVTGTMGTQHHARVHIVVKPTRARDFFNYVHPQGAIETEPELL